MRLTIPSATLRWAPLETIEAERMKPPSTSMTVGLPKACPTCAGVRMPTLGKRAIAMSAVTGMGSASVIQSVAQNRVIAPVQQTALG